MSFFDEIKLKDTLDVVVNPATKEGVEDVKNAVDALGVTLPLPTGAATSAKQDLQTTALNSIDTKLTSPLTVQATNLDTRDLIFATDKVDVSGSAVSITGSVTTGGLTDAQLRATPVPVSLISTTISNFPATQAVSAASLPLPSGASTSALQSTIDTSVNTLLKPSSTLSAVTTLGSITNPLPAGTNALGSITNTSFGINGTLPAFAATPTVNLGTIAGVATETTLSSINTKTPALGQAAMVGSQPVVIASNQSAIPVTGTFFQATQPVSAASLPLPTGAATSVQQTTIDTSINTLLKPASTLAAVTTLGSITSALPTGANSIGQVTANAGTNLNTSLLGLETTQQSILTGIQLIDNSVGTVAAGTAGTGSLLTGAVFNTTLPTLTTGQQVANQVDSKGRFLNSVTNGRLSFSCASGVGAAGFAAAATANTDIYRISGSATKTIYVKKIRISATATAVQGNQIAIIKRSTLNTAGVFVADVNVPYNSAGAASTATTGHYTTAPTLGTAVGEIRATKFLIPTAVGLYNSEIIFEFTENRGNPIMLNGINESLGILINVAPGAGNNFLINIDFDEE